MYEKFKKIKTIVTDIDGVLTNNSLTIAHDNSFWRVMNARDGMAIVIAIKAGYRIIVITGGKNEKVAYRLRYLGVKDVHMGCSSKEVKLKEIIDKKHLKKEEIAYIGDDLNDLAVFDLAGLCACPKDAAPEIKAKANYISPVKGGYGCVRDLLEKILKLNDDWYFSQTSEV